MIREIRRRVALWLLPKPSPTRAEKLLFIQEFLCEDRRARMLASMSDATLIDLAWMTLGSEAAIDLGGPVKDSIIEELCRRAYAERRKSGFWGFEGECRAYPTN